jgi:hypothetical protein
MLINAPGEIGGYGRGVWGLMCFCTEEVADAWVLDMQGPNKRFSRRGRFFFTEEGWDKYGRKIVSACKKSGQKFRIHKIKENKRDVAYQDKIQVVLLPPRKKSRKWA